MPEIKLPAILKRHQSDILTEWIREQTAPGVIRSTLIRENELRAQCEEFLALLVSATQRQNVTDVGAPEFAPLRDMLDRIARSRGEQGFTPSETATFVFSLKRPLFSRLRKELEGDASGLFEET